MVTPMNRNIIDSTLELLTKISCDMQEVLKSSPIYNIGIERLEIQRIKTQYPEVTAHLQNTYYFICDNWEKAESNPIFRHEIWLLTNEYNKFKDTVITLANHYDDHQEEVENTYGDSMIIYEYLIAIRNSDIIFQEIFNRIQQLHKGTEERQAKFKGISKALKDYIKGTSDDYLASLILDRQITADNRPQWIGPRNEGTLFAEHFKLSQKLMNSAFLFTDRSGNPSPLQMQKDKANNIAESYGIWQILQKYRI